MLSDGEALYRAVLDKPEEDTARLVYADWCDENGQELRAEFIRLQIALADQKKGKYEASPENDKEQDRLEMQEKQLLATVVRGWETFPCPRCEARGFMSGVQRNYSCPYCRGYKDILAPAFRSSPTFEVHWERGFPIVRCRNSEVVMIDEQMRGIVPTPWAQAVSLWAAGIDVVTTSGAPRLRNKLTPYVMAEWARRGTKSRLKKVE